MLKTEPESPHILGGPIFPRGTSPHAELKTDFLCPLSKIHSSLNPPMHRSTSPRLPGEHNDTPSPGTYDPEQANGYKTYGAAFKYGNRVYGLTSRWVSRLAHLSIPSIGLVRPPLFQVGGGGGGCGAHTKGLWAKMYGVGCLWLMGTSYQ